MGLLRHWSRFATGLALALIAACAHERTAQEPPPPLPLIKTARSRCKKSGPGLSLVSLRSDEWGALKNCVECSLKELPKLIAAKADGDPEKARLIYWQAELYAESAGSYESHVLEVEARIAAALDEGSVQRVAQLEGMQRRYAAAERSAWLKARDGYAQIARDPRYAGFERLEQVRFWLLACELQVGDIQAARDSLAQLQRDHPRSAFHPYALIELADAHFALHEFAAAQKLYDQLLLEPEVPLSVYALYKKAWIAYLQGDFQAAMDGFREVHRTAQAKPRDLFSRKIAREARADLVHAFAQLALPTDMPPLFETEFPEDAANLRKLLAKLDACRAR